VTGPHGTVGYLSGRIKPERYMKFIGSIVLLLSVCLFVAMPYGIGHGLAAHNNNAIIIGVVLGVLGIALFFLQKRLFGSDSH
jgi:hypothetical protein